MNEKTSLSYKDAGVDIDAGNALIENIKPIVKDTFRPGVMTGLGGFGGLFELPTDRYKQPVLVSGTDGVGTKLKLAIELNKHDTIGIDLVAMCANDIIVTGAEPLFFLDYYATGKLSVEDGTSIIKGIAEGCKQSGAALIGGETAEMPGMYSEGDYDLAGFCVGIVEKSKIINPETVAAGDHLIGIASSGPHSNGYSLIRKILETEQASLDQLVDGRPLGEALLTPTRIYVKALLNLVEKVSVHAMAHITGGGLPENLPRVMPEHTRAIINTNSWSRGALFDWLQEKGNVEENEMLRTFNCGVGMVVSVAEQDVEEALTILNDQGEQAWLIGTIEASENQQPEVITKAL